MKWPASEWVGVEEQSAQPLTKEMEEILWDKKKFTPETGIGLHKSPLGITASFLVFKPGRAPKP